MRSRQLFSHSGPDKKRLMGLIIIGIVALLCIAAIIFSMKVSYKPPGFEAKAVQGIPAVDESFLSKEIKSDFGYRFYMAANLYRQEDGSVYIYLTDPSDNEVNLMCEVYDADTEELYYKSGVISPGEYVEALRPKKDFSNVYHDIIVRVYAFEPETYISEGTTELKLALQPW